MARISASLELCDGEGELHTVDTVLLIVVADAVQDFKDARADHPACNRANGEDAHSVTASEPRAPSRAPGKATSADNREKHRGFFGEVYTEEGRFVALSAGVGGGQNRG